ncbi:BTAD domain-containing putative transcriptional regulator [Frankia sp. CpI1-P]
MAWPPPYPDLDAPAIPAAPPVPALVGPSPAPDSASATLPVSRPHRAGLRGPTAPTRLPTALRITGGVSLPDPDAARALILTVLAAHHTPAGDDPHHLILSRDAADALHLPAQLLARLRHVTLTPSALDAVTSAEQHLLTRQRLATEHDTATIGPLRAAAPDEHLPPVLLVVTADPALHPRLHALAGRGAALDLHTAALGDWPGQPRWPDPDSTDPDSSWSLRADAAADLLRLLDQATPTDTPTPADSTPSPARAEADPVGLADSTDTADTPAAADPGIETAAVRQDLAPADAASPSLSPSHDETVTPTPETRDANGDRPPPAPAEAPADTGGVLLVLLDRPHLLRDGDTVYQGRLGLEIAGFLALHRRPATTATLMAALLPDIDPDKAKDQIYQAIRRLREALRRAGADGVLLSDRNGYRLTDTLAVDAWDIDRALSAADTASDDTGRAAALHTATSLYTGRLLDGSEWATAHATELEHRMIDATADLADLLADDDPTAATRVLEHATTTLFPYTETLYTHLMRLHAAAGHPGDIHRAYRRLLTRLADLGTTPSPETDRLLARLTRPRHDPPPV